MIMFENIKMRNKSLCIGLLLCLMIFMKAVTAFAGDATLFWDPPTTNVDDTPLIDLAGYKIYYSTTPGYYDSVIDAGDLGDSPTYQVTNLTDGLIYYFAVTAYDVSGNESDYSNEVSRIIGGVCIASFGDVPDGHWAKDYINDLYCNSITTGYRDGTYRPENTVNRAGMAAFIIRALYGETFSYSSIPYFPDVADTHWAFKYIQRLYEEGITIGYGDGTYRPENTVNRADMAAFIIRSLYGETFSYSSIPYFPDVADTQWAFKYIQRLYEEGITIGYGDDTYRPTNTVNRAQMAAFISRAFLVIP